MTEDRGGVPPNRALPRRSFWRVLLFIELAIFVASGLTIVGFGCAATMFASAVINGIGAIFGDIVGPIFSAIIGNIFEGLGIALVVLAILIFPWLMELLTLLAAGQFAPLVARLYRLL